MEISLIQLALVLSYFTFTIGSRIDFFATPDTVTLGLTRSLSLRCSLSDTVDQMNTSIPIIGRRRREVKGQMVSSRDLSPTFNTKHVMSMIVTKIGEENETVASIVARDNPVGYVDAGRLEVQGQILSQPGERGYLELKWAAPSSDLRGMYNCKVNALDTIGQPISYVQDIEVKINEPNILQLLDRLLELESELTMTKSDHNNTKQQLSQTAQQLSQTQSELNVIKSDQNITKQQLSQTQSELNTAKQQITTAESTLTTLTPPHVEQGTAHCSSWNSTDIYINYSATQYIHWSATSGRESVQHVVFNRSYNSIPAVMISTSMMRTDTGVTVRGSTAYIGIMYQVNVENVTTRGFTIRCVYYYDVSYYEKVASMNVDWISTIMG